MTSELEASLVVTTIIIIVVTIERIVEHRRDVKAAAEAAQSVRGALEVTGVREQWRTGGASDEWLNRRYDVRLTVDAALTMPDLGDGGTHRYDVTLSNRDVAKMVVGARFGCAVLRTDPGVVRVYVRPGRSFLRFENSRQVPA